jgi:hypothetical protein
MVPLSLLVSGAVLGAMCGRWFRVGIVPVATVLALAAGVIAGFAFSLGTAGVAACAAFAAVGVQAGYFGGLMTWGRG